jgi:hypothetical protein
VTPELKSLRKRAPATKNHKVKAEKESSGFLREMSSHCMVCESGAGAKDFVANFCAEETETIFKGKNAHCSTTHAMLRTCPDGRASGLGSGFFLGEISPKSEIQN